MTKAVRVHHPRELLSYIPYALGFEPHASLVIMAMLPCRDLLQVGPIVRIDLPPDPPEELSEFVDSVRYSAALFSSHGASAFTVVVYPPVLTCDDLDHRDLDPILTPTVDAIEELALPVAVWLLSESDYCPVTCCDGHWMRGPVRGRTEMESTVVAASMVSLGASVANRREDIAALPQRTSEERRRAHRAAREWWARYRGRDFTPAQWRRACLDRWCEAFETVRGGAEVTPAQAGKVAAALRDILVRDAVVGWFVDPVSPLPRTCLSGGLATGLDSLLDQVLATEHGALPAPEVVAGALPLLMQVASYAAKGHGAPPLSLLAWMHWWLGHTVIAGLWAEMALADDPSYRFAALVRAMVMGGVMPGWMSADRSVA